MDGLPIGDYALLSDCRSAALVSRAGSVDWLCFPRFDAPATFARILDPAGGHFAIRPAGEFEASRAYLDQTMALETTFRTAAGTVVLTDAMAVGRNERGHDLGAGSPGVLLRRLACTAGEMDVEVSYAPRPEYGLIHPILEEVPGGLAARGGAGRLLLSAPGGFRVDGATAHARLHLTAGQTLMFALQHAPLWDPPLAAWAADEIAARLADTVEGWRSWSCDSPDLRGAMARPGPPFRPGAAGADVRADRGHRGRAHHVAARDDRRRAELGLPLHLGPRRQPDHGGAVGGGVPRRSGQVLRLPGRRGSVSAATRGGPADHVRDRRRARPVRARAAAPGRVAGQPAGAGGQRRVDPAAARRVRRAARRRAAADRAAGRAGPGHAAVPRRRGGHRGQPLEGEGPGDLGDPRRAARFPLFQADVLGGAGPGDRPGPAARRRRAGRRPGRPRGTRSGRPSWSTAGTPRSAPSPRRSAARISTPRT